MNEADSLRNDVLRIWRAGVEAVKPQRLIQDKLSLHGQELTMRGSDTDSCKIDFEHAQRLIIVGAGKASAAMAIAFEQHVLPDLLKVHPGLKVDGWINCPEGSFSPQDTDAIHCFPARPAGINIPTPKAVEGTQRILDLVSSADPQDVVICLLSGGGSALLTAPVDGISMEDKQEVAKVVAAAGGNIEQLNAIRRGLSKVKAGGLARHCSAERMTTLVISDVLGDCLATIASGPTDQQSIATPQAALRALKELNLLSHERLSKVVEYLEREATLRSDDVPPESESASLRETASTSTRVQHVILGSNRDAVLAAEREALRLGYETKTESATQCEEDVQVVAARLSATFHQMLQSKGQKCLISGGEPTVLLPENPGRGGRNQQLALSLLSEFYSQNPKDLPQFAFASGGTDGEDGPTDAAGAWFDRSVVAEAIEREIDPLPYLSAANAYDYFDQLNALLSIGPTGTNVCDLRVALSNAD